MDPGLFVGHSVVTLGTNVKDFQGLNKTGRCFQRPTSTSGRRFAHSSLLVSFSGEKTSLVISTITMPLLTLHPF